MVSVIKTLSFPIYITNNQTIIKIQERERERERENTYYDRMMTKATWTIVYNIVEYHKITSREIKQDCKLYEFNLLIIE